MCSKESQVGSFYTIESFHTKSRPPAHLEANHYFVREAERMGVGVLKP